MAINFNRYPYYDDFTKDNDYYRLLFQPGRSVQARELTQIQSLLQSQLDNMGRHLFNEGARVHGGTINYNRTTEKWLAVKALDSGGNPVRIRDISPGLLIKKPNSNKDDPFGKITSVIPAEATDPNTIYFQWVIEPDNDVTDGFLPNQLLQICDPISGVPRYNVTTMDVTPTFKSQHYGTASSLSVEAGIYFWGGLFVKASGGNVRLSKYENVTTYVVGYSVNETVNTDDPRSLDPAQHSSNYSAPGADRYEVKLNLVKVGNGLLIDDRVIPNFIEVCRIVDGAFIGANDGTSDIYNILGEELANRTYEESGNYVVEPYDLTLRDRTTTDNPKVQARMTTGVSYVRGHRHSLNERSVFTFDKARDTLEESQNILNSYGDNSLLIYDQANTTHFHTENANGLFTVGSGAGSQVSTAPYALRGEAVSIHCVPQQLVKDHSLTSSDTWHSTLVGTARPFQQVYNKVKSEVSNNAGRSGDVYNLWLGDFKSSPILGTTSVTNIITDVSVAANADFTTYSFPSQIHGLTANDRISVVGSDIAAWNVDHAKILTSNATAAVLTGRLTTAAAPDIASLVIHRTTGNNSAYKTFVLDPTTSAAWNGSYMGATIKIGNSPPRKIVDYIGTSSAAETQYNSINNFSKRGMVILDQSLSEIPKYGDSYTLNLTINQARSVVFNQNKSATGAEQFPAILNQSWNVDPISGIAGGDLDYLSSSLYGNRINGDALYNKYGDALGGEDSLLFSPKRTAIKSYSTHGNLDTGLSSNTVVYYTEYGTATKSVDGTELTFAAPAGANDYKFFNRPKPFPFVESLDTNVDGLDVIKSNFMLASRTSGKILTDAITRVQVAYPGGNIVVTLPSTNQFINTETYVLLYPVRAEFADPAYKKLIKANTTHSYSSSIPGNRVGSLSDFDLGHVFFANTSYGLIAGSKFNLMKPDGYKLRKVVHNLNNASANTDLQDDAKNITDRFIFNSGQRDMFYDNAYLELKSDANAPSGNVIAIFDRFERMDKPKSDPTRVKDISSPSFFNVDSYQWTTDLTLDHAPSQPNLLIGTKVVTDTNVTGYVLEYANTGGAYAKVRLQSVYGPIGSNGTIQVGQSITSYSAEAAGIISSTVKTVTTPDLSYSEIPVYESASSNKFALRNMLDFRPYVVTNNMVSDTISDGMMAPIPTLQGIKSGRFGGSTVMSFNDRMHTPVVFDHFAGRVDKVVVTNDGNYTTIKGNPAVIPFPPKDEPEDNLTLFQVNIPPYTFDPSNIEIKPTFAIRHTMKDIGRLARRVENLEYYVALNALEKSASDMNITFADGSTRFKNGIVVDNFMGSNPSSPNPVIDSSQSKIAVGHGTMRPQAEQAEPGTFQFVQKNNGSGVKTHYLSETPVQGDVPVGGSVTTLDYDVTPMITQASATTAESVNPFDLQNYTGRLRLSPDKDTWIDTTKVPEYNSFVSNILADITTLDENSTADEIIDTLRSMDSFWEEIAGSMSIGDDPALHGTSFYTEADGSPTQSLSKSISLGNVNDQYFNTSPIDAAISAHGMTDGVTKNIKILPYIRSRDVIVHASGLKPNHLNSLLFDGVSVESYFAQANRIYMNYDPEMIRAGQSSGVLFQPDVDGTYEKIKLTGDSGTANAILLAVRAPELTDDITASYMVGYIVPESKNDTGLIDYSTFKDGYYSGWSESDIKADGFQGTSSTSMVTGYVSQASVGLIAQGTGLAASKYNGHYTGTARNAGANTTHILLSPDAHRYRNENFKGDLTSMTYDVGVPAKSRISIVAGAGAGQECVANGIIYTDAAGHPCIELKSTVDGSTGISTSDPIDATSVYTIGMKSVAPVSFGSIGDGGAAGGFASVRYPGISKIADITARTNQYGEKLGVLRIPSNSRTKFTTGRKLVEILDRYSKEVWLVSSYASAYYFAEGVEREQIGSNETFLEVMEEVRSRLNGYRITNHPNDLGYIPATDNNDGSEGKLALVTGVNIANGVWTALNTDGITFVPGGGEYGTVDFLEQAALANKLTGTWAELKHLYPAIYEKYYSQYGTQE